ncbi:MAG: LLM class F420-dependent oxidoreductase [Chloroflexia bacterium]|nr:LLM class F420-dependent oxidoreductase [Chloroflexia bacterium]
MQIGVVYPQTELGDDAGEVREFAQAVEALGFSHLLAYDHVLGAGTRTRPGWQGAYKLENTFHEVFVLFGFVAALTTTLELATGVLILPQRQTALVAKQAAAIDVLSRGRLRLGVGIGWNKVEYDGLNEDFHTRGRRLEEQIALLRALWTEDEVTFEGRWDQIDHAGINPRPVQRPIPIWIGGYADAAIRRAARVADGYFPGGQPWQVVEGHLAILREELIAAGRDPATFPIEPRLNLAKGDEESWALDAGRWRELGATLVSLSTMNAGCASVEDHLALLRRGQHALAGID